MQVHLVKMFISVSVEASCFLYSCMDAKFGPSRSKVNILMLLRCGVGVECYEYHGWKMNQCINCWRIYISKWLSSCVTQFFGHTVKRDGEKLKKPIVEGKIKNAKPPGRTGSRWIVQAKKVTGLPLQQNLRELKAV